MHDHGCSLSSAVIIIYTNLLDQKSTDHCSDFLGGGLGHRACSQRSIYHLVAGDMDRGAVCVWMGVRLVERVLWSGMFDSNVYGGRVYDGSLLWTA